MDNLKGRLFTYLDWFCRGHENAIKKATLANMFGVDTRMVEEAIHELRNTDMEPIGSSGNGYFIAVTDEEMTKCLSSLYRRAFNQLKTARVLERRFNMDPPGRQQVLELLTGS